MYHPLLKMTSQEPKDGKMVEVASVCDCLYGERFPSDRQLRTHVYEPLAPRQEN